MDAPTGNDAPLTDPAPPDDPTPDYLYPGTYDSSGNPYDGPSGCAVDGQPMPCSLTMRLLHFGRSTGLAGGQAGSGGSVITGTHVWVDEWEDFFIPPDPNDPWDGGTVGARNVGRFVWVPAGASPPGNTGPIIVKTTLTSHEVDDLEKDLHKLLSENETCRKFIAGMLTAAGDTAKNPPTTTDMMKLFSIVSNQLGFAYATEIRPGPAGTSRLGYSGVYSTGGYSQVLLSASIKTNFSDPAKVREEHLYVTLGELTHIAGEKKWGRKYEYHGSIGYGDNELLRAGAGVAQTLGLPVPKNIPDPKTDTINFSSRLYHQLLERACGRKL